MIISDKWKDYEILDMADGEKLERWGNIVLIRPDPQIIWKSKSKPQLWKKLMRITIEAKQVAVNGSI